MPNEELLIKQNIRIQKIVAFLAVSLFILKFLAWYVTHSLAVYTDALESIANILGGFFGLYSLYVSAKPRDDDHPYGHGKVEFIAAAVEGTFVVIAGILIIIRLIKAWGEPHNLADLDKGMLLIGLTGVINYAVGWWSIVVGKKNKSLPLVASGRHLHSDSYSTVGIIIGLGLLIWTKQEWIDTATAGIFAIIIIGSGLHILREATAGIMDEADPELIKEIVDFINTHRRENWIDMHNLRIIKYGRILHLDVHMTVPWYLNVREAHIEQEMLADLLRIKYGKSVELFAHLDPCQPFSCPLCTKEKCPVRQHPFVKQLVLTQDNIRQTHKHHLDK